MINTMKRLLAVLTAATLTVITFPLPFLAIAEDVVEPEIVPQTLLISEVQTGGLDESDAELPKAEFIELVNTSGEEISVSGWQLEYLSASHTGIETPTRIIAELDGVVIADGYVLLSYVDYLPDADIYFGMGSTLTSGLMAKGGGHVRLIDADGNVIDQVGWGSAKQIADWPRTGEIPPGFSIKRILPEDPLYELGLIFGAATLPTTPEGGGLIIPEPPLEEDDEPIDNPANPDPETDDEDDIIPLPAPELGCEGIIISELLPNPAGADGGKEFIELYNPTTDFINLSGCGLQLQGKTHVHVLGDIELAPGQHRAFHDNETNIVLPNAAGGTIYLLSPKLTELQSVTYGENLPDDVAWAWFGTSDWQATYTPTPNAANVSQPTKPLEPCPAGQERNADTNRCVNITAVLALADCGPGQERNPETNRCRKIADTESSLTPCKPGQERNPDTNRCRAVAAATTLVPCAPDQERNPETNRCRKIAGAGSTLAPCAPGQERNHATNRCRKIASAVTSTAGGEIQDIESIAQAGKTGWWLAGFAGSAAVTYGAWEWRRDIINFLTRFTRKSPQTSI